MDVFTKNLGGSPAAFIQWKWFTVVETQLDNIPIMARIYLRHPPEHLICGEKKLEQWHEEYVCQPKDGCKTPGC